MMITHIISLKIQTWVTDYKSTDTAATIADFLLRVIATNVQVCNILKRFLSVMREAHNIGEDGTTGVSVFLRFFQYAAYLMTVT
jgi:hypothetical protein